MNDIRYPSRRDVIRIGMLAAAGALVHPVWAMGKCDPTPGVGSGSPNADDWSGPFWREGAPFRHNLRGRRVDGQVLVVSGSVSSASDCRPIPGAVLDVWHCSPDGVYFTNPEQESAGLFRGRIRCDAQGYYEYETMVPVPYMVGGAFRPAHIHVTAHAPEHEHFVTQMYFEGDPYLESDPLALVREPLICQLHARDRGDVFRGRRSSGSFFITNFDLAIPTGRGW